MNQVISTNLSKIRILNKLSKVQMSEIMGITRQTYSKIENGADIKWDSMARLRTKLEIDLNELVLDEYTFKLSTSTTNASNNLHQLFTDFVDYDLNPDFLRTEIIKKILNKTILKKPFAMRVLKLQNNRLIIEFMMILTHLREETNSKILRNKAKSLLEETIKKHKASLFDKIVKKSLLRQSENLTNLDCYYLVSYPEIAIQILSNSISKFDKQTMRYLGCKVLKD